MKHVYVDLRQTFVGAQTAIGPKRPFAAACTPSSARGQVARGTFSGPRSRGTRCGPRRAIPSTPAKLAKSQDTANGACARTPSHLPRPPGGTPAHRPSPWVVAGRWWCPRAQAPFAVSWLVLCLACDDAAVRGGSRRCSASVGRRTGAPRPGAQSLGGWACADRRNSLEAPGHLPTRSRWGAHNRGRQNGAGAGCAQRRTAAMGRKQPFTMHLNFMRRVLHKAQWSN